MIFRFITSGESHGKCLNAIIEGVPSGISISEEYINNELARRQAGYGRGARMNIEHDKVVILSGVRHGKSTGAPICLQIENKDWENWRIAMSVSELDNTPENEEIINSKKIVNVRPGHADYAGALKYNQYDVRNILERSSARETAARVAVGAVAKAVLKEFSIEGISYVTQIGKVIGDKNINPFDYVNEIENSPFRTVGVETGQKMKNETDEAKAQGDTLGGRFCVVFKNVPVGLGSHVHWDRKLDGQLAQAVMSIQAVKSVEIGMGSAAAGEFGSKVHDEIFAENGKYYRKTNNAGGIEGGISNGENIIVYASMKPIPTMKKMLNSVALDIKENVKAHFERSDTCAVPACAVVAESMCAIVLVNALFEKFTHDSLFEMKKNYENYIKHISER